MKWQADRRPEVLAAVRRRLQMPPLSPRAGGQAVGTQRLAMETACGLFPVELEAEMRAVFLTDHDAKRIAMAGAWLARFDGSPEHRRILRVSLTGRFPDWKSEPRSFTRLFAVVGAAIWERLDLLGFLRRYGTAGGSFRMLGAAHAAWLPGFEPQTT